MMESGSNRPRKSFMLAIFLAITGLAVSVYNTLTSDIPSHIYELNELGYSRVLRLFEDGVKEVVVMHDWGTDTLRSMEAYILLRDRISQIQAEDEYEPVVRQQLPERSDNTGNIKPVSGPILRLDIAGDRKKGQELYFTIEDYDPRLIYFLDYGDGQKYRVDKVSSFSYDQPGWYKVNLIASGPDNSQHSYAKTIRISSAAQKDGSNWANTAPSDPPEPKSFAELDLIEGETWVVKDSSERPTAQKNLEVTDLGGDVPQEIPAKLVEVEVISPPETPSSKTSTSIKVNQKDAGIAAEIMPEFPGGGEAMRRYFAKHARYPTRARDAGVEGTVLVRAVVRPNGALTDLKVIKGIGFDCDKEAMRLISKMPRWIAGEQDGVKVPIYKVIPVQFRLLQ